MSNPSTPNDPAPPTIISDAVKARLRRSGTKATTAVQLSSALPYPDLQTLASRSPQMTRLIYAQEVVRDGAVGFWRMGPTLVDGVDQVPTDGVYPLIVDPPAPEPPPEANYLDLLVADGATHAWSLEENGATNTFADAIGSLALTSSPRAASAMASTAIGPAVVSSPLFNGVMNADGSDATKDAIWSATTDLGAAVGDLTIEMFIKLAPVTGPMLGVFIGVFDAALSTYAFLSVGGSVYGADAGKAQGAVAGAGTLVSTGRVDDDTLHLVALSRSSGLVTLIVDGVAQGSTSFGTAMNLSAVKAQVGAIDYSGTKVYSYAGRGSWAAYYPVGLTAVQVLAHYEAATA